MSISKPRHQNKISLRSKNTNQMTWIQKRTYRNHTCVALLYISSSFWPAGNNPPWNWIRFPWSLWLALRDPVMCSSLDNNPLPLNQTCFPSLSQSWFLKKMNLCSQNTSMKTSLSRISPPKKIAMKTSHCLQTNLLPKPSKLSQDISLKTARKTSLPATQKHPKLSILCNPLPEEEPLSKYPSNQ